MLLWWPKYELMRWVPNPLNFQASDAYRKKNPPVLMTSRLDGPTAEIAKRLVDDAVAVEARGLSGNVVIDARGISFDPKGDTRITATAATMSPFARPRSCSKRPG